MRIFHKTLIFEITYFTGVVLLMTGGIFSVIKLLELLRSVAKGQYPFEGLTLILLLKLVTFLDVILAPTLLIAILLVLMRWSRDNEITVYSTSGISPTSYFVPAALVSLSAALIVASLSFVISPYAELKFQRLLDQYQQKVSSIPFSEGYFRSTGENKSVVYFSKLDIKKKDPLRLFYYDPSEGNHMIIVAERGAYSENAVNLFRTMKVDNGTLYRISSDWKSLESIEFSSYTELIPIRSNPSDRLPTKVKNILELINSSSERDLMEINWRLSKVFTAIVVVLLGFALGGAVRKPRVNINLVGAVILYFMYSSLLGFIAEFTLKHHVAFGSLLWLPHIVMLALITVLIVRGQYGKSVISKNLTLSN